MDRMYFFLFVRSPGIKNLVRFSTEVNQPIGPLTHNFHPSVGQFGQLSNEISYWREIKSLKPLINGRFVLNLFYCSVLIHALRNLLRSRKELADWEVKNYERKVVVLESKLHAWIKGEDTAPFPRGYLWQNDGFVCGCG